MDKNINEEEIFSDGFWIECGGKEDFTDSGDIASDQVYPPYYPVDMEHPVELTELQQEHSRILIEAIDKYFDKNPEDAGTAPLLRISQNWEVEITRGGHMMDTDFVNPILCIMCHEEEGYYIDYDYVKQCVPFIEGELEDIKQCVETQYDSFPSFREQEINRDANLEMDMLSLLASLDPKYGYERILIAIDRVVPEVYAWPIEEGTEEYGGLIKYYRADTLISPNGTIDVDRVKEIVREALKPF